jgi:hypothetical protein
MECATVIADVPACKSGGLAKTAEALGATASLRPAKGFRLVGATGIEPVTSAVSRQSEVIWKTKPRTDSPS